MADETSTNNNNDNKTLPPVNSGNGVDKKEKEHFSREYVHELREENKSWRLKSQELEKQLQLAKTEVETKVAESTKAVESANMQAQERILRSELKAHAVKEGIVDLDYLKLVDLSKLKLSEDGELTGAEELFEDLKKSKPHYFQDNKSSSSTHKTPDKKSDQPKSARDMTPEEYAKEKERITRMRR